MSFFGLWTVAVTRDAHTPLQRCRFFTLLDLDFLGGSMC